MLRCQYTVTCCLAATICCSISLLVALRPLGCHACILARNNKCYYIHRSIFTYVCNVTPAAVDGILHAPRALSCWCDRCRLPAPTRSPAGPSLPLFKTLQTSRFKFAKHTSSRLITTIIYIDHQCKNIFLINNF